MGSQTVEERLRRLGTAEKCALLCTEGPRLVFAPPRCLTACAWDEDLWRRQGRLQGLLAVAGGAAALAAPGPDVQRDPFLQGGERLSEDPFLAGKAAAAFLRGTRRAGVAAGPSRFPAQAPGVWQMTADLTIDERALRELFLEPFERALREGGADLLVPAFGRVNGEYAADSRRLLTDVARREWGFDGLIVNAWGGSGDPAASVCAGVDLEQPGGGTAAVRALVRAADDGRLPSFELDRHADRVLRMTARSTDCGAKRDMSRRTLALSRRAVARGTVLLKNEGELLPLAPDRSVAVVGALSASGLPLLQTLADCLRPRVRLAGWTDRPGEAARLARRADTVLLLTEAAGPRGGETSAKLAPLLRAVRAENPRVAVLLAADGPVPGRWPDGAQALMLFPPCGGEGAAALARLLTGRTSPCGRLPVSWPLRADKSPGAAGDALTESVYLGYRYWLTAAEPVRFPFGHGLSYTRFAYSGLRLEGAKVCFEVENIGFRPGVEVAQLYLTLPGRQVFSPAAQLRGFARLRLRPREKRTVRVELDSRAFCYWNSRSGAWAEEAGVYRILVGPSCEAIRLETELRRAGTRAPDPYLGMAIPHYRTGQVRQATGKEFDELRRCLVVSPPPAIDRNLPLGRLHRARSPLGWLVRAVLKGLISRGLSQGRDVRQLLFVWGLPLRALPKATEGRLDEKTIDALVLELRGFWGAGLLAVVASALGRPLRDRALAKRSRREQQ